MSPNDYQELVAKMPLYDDVVLGLVGELGEVVELVKKDRRPFLRRKPLSRERLVDESGDVLWYFTRFLSENGISLEEVMTYNLNKLEARHAESNQS